MDTRELIARLQELDPEGALGVGIEGKYPVRRLELSPSGRIIYLLPSEQQMEWNTAAAWRSTVLVGNPEEF